MPLAPAASGTVTDNRDGRVYQVNLYRPHVLALAINDAFPAEATRFAVNIGATDGMSMNDPVYPLYAEGWGGVAIEGDECPELFTNLPGDNVLKLTNTFITPLNMLDILTDALCPVDADFVKIDVDGYDGPLLKALLELGYRPKVIQVEINPEFPPPIEFAIHYSDDYRGHDDFQKFGLYGTSLSYVANVARRFGYSVAHLDFVTAYTHDVVLVQDKYLGIAEEVFGQRLAGVSIREMFLAHPPGYSHLAEIGIDSYSWRYRTDYHQLLNDIWQVCMRANLMKHGGLGVPFHLSF